MKFFLIAAMAATMLAQDKPKAAEPVKSEVVSIPKQLSSDDKLIILSIQKRKEQLKAAYYEMQSAEEAQKAAMKSKYKASGYSLDEALNWVADQR